MQKKLRVVFLDGPGDAIESFRFWLEGVDNPNITHIAFSQQLFDACRGVDAKMWVIGEHPRVETFSNGDFTIEHRGNPTLGKAGLAYHRAVLSQAVQLIVDIIRFRTDVVISADRPYPVLMHFLRLFGIKTVIHYHCVLWCKDEVPSGFKRLLNRLNATFLRRGCAAIACVSEEIKGQVRQLTGRTNTPFVDFLPWMRKTTFDGIAPPDIDQKPTRVMFAGRIEENKGVFDLLDIASRLRDRGITDIVFDICGTGSALDALRARVAAQDLAGLFIIHGHCTRAQMRDVFGRSHMVVVPTRRSFNEGFNMVVAEALLAQRPVISSTVCPAVSYVPEGVLLVAPDNGQEYEEAILRLATDRQAYLDLQSHSYSSGRRFLDEATSYRAAFEHIFRNVARGQAIPPREIAVAVADGPGTRAGTT